MRRSLGYIVILHGDGAIEERDAAVCCHCQRLIELKPGAWGQVMLIPHREGYREAPACFCSGCSGPICEACEAARVCRPFAWRREVGV